MNHLFRHPESLVIDSGHRHQPAAHWPIPTQYRWPIAAALLWLVLSHSQNLACDNGGRRQWCEAPAGPVRQSTPDPLTTPSGREQTSQATAGGSGVQDEAGQPRPDLAIGDVTVTQFGQRLRLTWPASADQRQELRLPRLAATVRSCQWSGEEGPEIGVVPEPTEWLLRWTGPAPANAAIDMVLESEPLSLPQVPPIQPTADGSVWLAAHLAATHGRNLRFEPQPYKNTIGYWTLAEDHAVWSLTVDQPGQYRIAVLQGCGAGQGGSDARIELLRGATVVATEDFKVEETGHFQNFAWRSLGLVQIEEPGPYQLKLSARRIARAAVGDFRAIHLVRQAQ